MVEIICGACEHPGSHVQALPPGTAMRKRCEDCPRCKAEAQKEGR